MFVYNIQFINNMFFECCNFVRNLSFLLHIASDTDQLKTDTLTDNIVRLNNKYFSRL